MHSVTVGVHDGDFHADDCLSVHFLKLLYDVTSVVRTRDQEQLAKCDIVVDVGGVFDAQKNMFDHHQLGFAEYYENSDVLLCGAGLLFRQYGEQIILKTVDKINQDRKQQYSVPDDMVKRLKDYVYFAFVQQIDGNDNGIDALNYSAPQINIRYQTMSTSLSSRISYLNDIGTFDEAVALAGHDFTEYVHYCVVKIVPQMDSVAKAIETRFSVHKSGKVIQVDDANKNVIEMCAKQQNANIEFTIMEKQGQWRIRALPINSFSFQLKHPLPKEWRGHRDCELDGITGIQGGVFVHKNGFLGIWKTKDALDQVLDRILQ